MKPLNFEQRKQFKELYLAEYSATMIFEKLGLTLTTAQAMSKMRNYRISMKLPKRYTGYQPKFSKRDSYLKKCHTQRIKNNKKKIVLLKQRIDKYSNKIEMLKTEITSLTNGD
jgi:hypothetical protein